MSRRWFLARTARTSAAVTLGTPLLAACQGQDVVKPAGSYDVIVVGGGTAGIIVATALQRASAGTKRILLVEAGGPTLAASGGKAYPPWVPARRTDLTMFDVPGEYGQIAWTAFGAQYRLAESAWTYQGIGLGGNSVFNGMLFQTNPPAVFDQRWPVKWQWRDMQPYFERVRAHMPVTNTPSTDGVPQCTAPADIVHGLYARAGFAAVDTSRPFAERGAYSRPYVVAANGRRAGPMTGYFPLIAHGGVPAPGLELLLYTKAERIEFDVSGAATAVHFTRRAGLDQRAPATSGTARLRSGGLLVLAAGALITPRLLLSSGVGPRGREAEIFPGRPPVSFAIDNPCIGVGLFDHVAAKITYSYAGPVPYTAYDYGAYDRHAADLARYLADGSGPYAQYKPVSILSYRLGSDIPNVEIFIEPNGSGARDGPYDGPRTFTAYVMLLDPKARGLVVLEPGGNVRPPSIYLPATPDGAADATLMAQAMFDMIQLFAQDPALTIVFGPGSASHPHLDPQVLADVRAYLTGPSPVDGVSFNRLVCNHWGGTVMLTDGPGGVDPATLIVRGTRNVAVVDASLLPTCAAAHPVGTIMAVADRAGEMLAARWV